MSASTTQASDPPPPSSTVRALLDLVGHARTRRFGPDENNRADLYVPRGKGPHPVAICVHGGFWQARYSRRYMRPLCAHLARSGIAAWNIEYRRLGNGGGWPETFEDVALAVDALAEVAPDAGLDMTRVSALGHSAGAHLALWAAARPKLAAGAVGSRPAVVPSAVAALAPVCDIESFPGLIRPNGAVAQLIGGTPAQVSDRYAIANPARNLPLGVPILLLQTTEDRQIPPRFTRGFLADARAAGDQVEYTEMPGTHSAPADPRGPQFAKALRWLKRH